ncbi:MAG: glycosyltransferase [Chitinophagales bacterium]|nr:glycosyltransferase [Chitinophagales bacterium]
MNQVSGKCPFFAANLSALGKKISIISPAHPLRGGIAASSERLARQLISEGHEVIMWSYSLQYPNFLFPGKTQYSSDPAPEDLHIRTCINSINPFNWIRVAYLLGRAKPDLIVCRFWLPLMGPCLGAILHLVHWFGAGKAERVALVDNMIPHEKRPGDRLFSRWFCSACDRFVVMSQSVGDDIKQFAPKKPQAFAPHPIYDIYGEKLDKKQARNLLQVPENENIILFFGIIRAYKGLDLLLEALALIPEVHLIIAGEPYGDWSPYAEQIERLQLRNRITLHTDFIPAERVNQYFSAADLVVQPYKTATQSGISQIAYHFDKPMVVTHVGGLPEIVPHGKAGYVVAPEAQAIADAIQDFFQHQRATAMEAGVREAKKRFSWKNLSSVISEQ